jgi:uncharacterized protein (TIGR03000 family)
LDCCGYYIPGALILAEPLRRIEVPGGVSIIDEPKIRLNMHCLQLGRRYTAVFCLRGHQSCISFTPILEAKKTSTEPERERMPPLRSTSFRPADARIILTVSEGAEVIVNEDPLAIRTGRQVFVAPGLLPGRDYHYAFVATYSVNGKATRISKRIDVKAGEEVQVDLRAGSQPEKLDAPRLLDSAQAMLRVTVPDGAELFVNDKPAQVTGQTHVLVARDLPHGERRSYSLKAVFTTCDEYVTVLRNASVGAGEQMTVDLNVPREIARREQKNRPKHAVDTYQRSGSVASR